jgi:hypothetical protein
LDAHGDLLGKRLRALEHHSGQVLFVHGLLRLK